MKSPATGILALLIASSSLAACGRHKDAAPPVQVPKTLAALPALPEWAPPYIGKKLSDFGTSTGCRGAFDGVEKLHVGSSPGAEVRGWGWLTSEKKTADEILFMTEQGRVVGAAASTENRPDVGAAIPEVTALKVGWTGVVTETSGLITAQVLLPNNSVCKLGSFEISAQVQTPS